MPFPDQLKKYLTGEFDQGVELTKLRVSIEDKAIAFAKQGNTNSSDHEAEKRVLVLKHRDGVCQCLAVKWLKRKMKERREGLKGSKKVSSVDRVSALADADRLFKAVQRQDVSGKKQYFTAAFEEVLNLYGVKAMPYWDTQTTLKEVGKKVSQSTHGYFVVGIKCPKIGGNHAIAVYTSGGKAFGKNKHAYVFDPNFGEMAFPLEQFASLFKVLVTQVYGTLENGIVIFAQLIYEPVPFVKPNNSIF